MSALSRKRPLSAGLGPSNWLPAVLGLARRPSAGSGVGAALSDSQLWIATQVLDYAWVLGLGAVVSLLFGSPRGTWAAAAACTALGLASVALLQHRETGYFYLLAHKVPRCKQRPLERESYWFIFQTAVASMFSFFLMHELAIVYFVPPTLTLSFWLSIFGPFYALLVLRDLCFMGPLHPLLHRPRWYGLHKRHHEPTKSAQSLHAFHIDLVDLLIENVGAPFLLFALQRALGLRVGVHWYVGLLLTCHDGALHSVNPHSAMYFNPILDAVFKANVHHQLHHALNKDYYFFVPWAHVLPARRRADCDRYNKTFETDFAFGW